MMSRSMRLQGKVMEVLYQFSYLAVWLIFSIRQLITVSGLPFSTTLRWLEAAQSVLLHR